MGHVRDLLHVTEKCDIISFFSKKERFNLKRNTIAIIIEKLFAKSIIGSGENDCWEWTGARTQGGFGYGTINIYYTKWSTHRISWVIHNKKQIPKGFEVCHTCDNPSCWRPDHLFIGTHKDNMQDSVNKGRLKGGGVGRLKEADLIKLRIELGLEE